MLLTSDMKEFIELLEKNHVEYVMVGGFAVIYYGYPRTTQDVDILIFPSIENALKMMDVLEQFGFGRAGITRDFFETEGTAIHIGVEPNRIDLLTNLKGVSNEEIFKRKKRIKYKKVLLNIISLNDLLISKKCSNRLKDLADVDELEKKLKK